MAAVADGAPPPHNNGAGHVGPITGTDESKIQEYEKIIKFRDAVIAGKHPRIKVPAHLVPKSPKSRAFSTSAIHQSTLQHQQQPAINGNALADNYHAFWNNGLEQASNSPVPGSGSRPEINPIFLEKSDELLRAEFQIKRSRVEGRLKEQVDQQRLVKLEIQRATDQAPDFNLVEVLQNALALVQGASRPTDPKAAASKPDDAADSFDENTFYSSNFSTPGSNHVARLPDRSEDEDVRMDESSDYEPDADDGESPPKQSYVPVGKNNLSTVQGSILPAQAAARQQEHFGRPQAEDFAINNQGYQRHVDAAETMYPNQRVSQMISSNSHESGEASASGESGVTDQEQSHDEFGRRRRSGRFGRGRASREEPALVRSHNLSPVAPQPAHISALANPRHAPITIDDLPTTRGTPAPVAALRRHEAAITSPESSPQNANPSNKKNQKQKKNKNKRKADRDVERAPSPYIKPEPKSPSPMSAPAYARPNKRQKQGPGQAQVTQVEYEDGRYEPAPQSDGGAMYRQRGYGDEAIPVVYQRLDGQQSRPIILEDSGRQAYGSYEPRYLEASQMARPDSRGAFRIQSAAPVIQRPMSRAFVEIPAQSGYSVTPRVESRTIYEAPRMSVRPQGGRERSRSPVLRARSPVMAPPSRANPPRKIIVDEYGREYIEPPRPTPSVIRQSVPPVSRPGEPEVIYEQRPARAASRMPDTFEQDGVVYRRASPSYPPARRVVTQPEYAIPEQQPIYRQREYSVRPQAMPEYAPVRQTTASRPVEEPPRSYGYVDRAPSMRPVESSNIRYEVRDPYGDREYHQQRSEQVIIQPGQPPMTRAYSVRPEAAAPVVQRAYSVRPAEPQVLQGSYSGHQIVRGEQEVQYIQRPRGGPEVQYVEENVQYAPQGVRRQEFY